MIFLAPISGLIVGIFGGYWVVLLYMLRLRRRPISVSSTLLWSKAIKDMEGNIPWQRISPTLLLWLHLLIVLMVALAIARPVIDDEISDGQRVFLVLDTSASMKAQIDGVSLFERSKEQAIDRVKSLFDSGRQPIVSVIASGFQSEVILADSSQRGQLIGAIQGINASDQPGELEVAIGFIEELIESAQGSSSQPDGELVGAPVEADSLVWIFTDGGSLNSDQIPMRGGVGISVSPVPGVDDASGQRENMGIAAISAARDRADPYVCRVFVRLVGNLESEQAAVLRLFDGDELITSKAVAIEKDEDAIGVSFEIRLTNEVLLRAQLDVDDALGIDDRAWVAVPSPQPVRIAVVAPGGNADPLLVDMLGVIAQSTIQVVSEADPVPEVDLIVYDRVVVDRLIDMPAISFASVFGDQSGSGLLDQREASTRMISWDRSDPLVRDAGFGSISYQRSFEFDESEPGMRVLGRDGRGAILVTRNTGSHRHIGIGFALHDSNWAVQVGFPIFLVNAIEGLLPGAGGVGDVYTTRDVIPLKDTSGVVGPIDRVGVHQFGTQTFGVGLLNEQESAMSFRDGVRFGSVFEGEGSSAGQPISQEGGAFGASQRELWRWFTLMAMLLIALEWIVYSYRVRVRL